MLPWLLFAAYLVSTATASIIAVISWRRRARAPIAGPTLSVIAGGLAWWAAAEALLVPLSRTPYGGAVFMALAPGAGTALAGFWCLARALADRDWRPRRRTVLLLAVEPLVVLVGAATNPLHRLFLVAWEPHPGGWIRWQGGPLYWADTVYLYTLVVWGSVVLVRGWGGAGSLHRRQLGLVLVGAAVPVVGNALSMSSPWHADLPDLTAVLFTATAGIDAYAIFKVGLFDLAPVARSVVLDHLTDGVFVIDTLTRLIDVNCAGRRLLRDHAPGLPRDPVGVPASEIVARLGLTAPLGAGELRVTTHGRISVLDVRTAPVTDSAGQVLGEMFVVRDITAAHAQQAALAAANHRLRHQVATIEQLRAELAEQAVRDELTGLHNRRHLVTALDRAIGKAVTGGGDLAVVLLDVDHFKAVNDRYGHAVGDAVLVATAEALAAGVREHDTLARYGGEEFVVLLPGATREQAVERAEQWRLNCAAVLVESSNGPVSVTISAGVATLSATGADPAALLRAADDALYAAKAGGRDRVVVAS